MNIKGVLGLALVMVIPIACGQLPRPKDERAASTPASAASSRESEPVAAEAQPIEALRLETSAYDLAFDRRTNNLWLAVMRGDGPDFLYRVDADTHESERWQLPETLHNGFLSEVEVTDDGGIWIAYEYLLVRFDPQTLGFKSKQFPIVQPEADRAGGTWISGLGSEGNAVWVAFNGLSKLVLIDPAMHEVEQVALTADFAGADDVAAAGGYLYVLRSNRDDGLGNITEGGVGIFDGQEQMTAFAAAQASRLQVLNGRVLVRGGDSIGGETAWVGADGSVDRVEAGFPLLAIAASTNDVITYDVPYGQEPGVIERHQDDVSTVLVTFPKELVEWPYCPIRPPMGDASVSPAVEPTCPPIWSGAPDITAMAVDASGALWYVESVGRGSILWTVPLSPQ